jgi:hypothetical protein
VTATCPICGAEQAEGLLCHACTTALERELGDVAAIVAELDISLSKQARIGNAGSPGLARERTPINVGTVDPRWILDNVLGTWARDIMGEPDARWSPAFVPSRSPAITASRVMLSNASLIRRHPAVTELVDEITDAIAQARRAVDRPADRVYLGQCYVETPDPDGKQVTCLAELYASPTASEVQCKVCGAEHPVGERRAWLLQRAADMIVTVKEASSYLGEIGGIKVSQSSIRGYLHRGRLAYRPGVENGIRLGDLLNVVMDESERKSA